ncbi:filamentous hemagglutinin N-terminal domain-containing protein [Microvirga sp. SRT01]|uniref:Filamentous hemagglutinin N-terminal domain-containing protein n=1 Tax=Sphingomonas longa TaxID=2778730 RepID=A0ABS2D1I7_9SPHN|nr:MULTISPECIES: filamentous hemagglutinin N-terminal domain-containing protein [Alphaproteobacteria]MBM6574780.1 filamentous hemagglutinin N-terminal domain-containing protein [Sphingomonas sp. BT552]MBR7707832.1 filamentous hemagglutinin N-terminal domain-containing protein [Microvirga sp. SRT01]
MTRSRPAPTPLRLPGRLRGRLVLTTALGGCLAAFAATAARAQDLPVVAPVGTLIGSPTGVTPGVATDAIGVTQTGTIIDWQSFNIGTGQTVTISDARTGPAAGSRMTMLNRVTGLLGIVPRSQIDGTLNGAANIAVYIVNPSGIVFGNNAVVNVGGLIASTLAISDTNFAAGNYIFADPGNTAGITVASSANLTSTGLAADQLGLVALIGARIDSAGTIAAAGDVALVAASDVTLTYDAANPLGFTVREGTSLGTVTTGGVTTNGPMVVSGTIGGRSALFVAATRQTVTDAVLDMSSAVTATTAVATDRGIVLIAGRDNAADARVTFASGPGGAPLAANSGTVSLALGGAALNSGLTAAGAGGAIRLASNGGIGGGSGAAPFASSLAASQAILATSLTGDVLLGSATGNSVGVTATAGGVSLGTAVAGVGGTALNAGAGALAFATLESSGAITGTASGDITGTSAITTGGTMSLVSSGGTLAIGSASSAGAMTLNGAVATRVDTAVTSLAGSDLSVLGGAVSGVGAGTRATLTAGGALDVTVTGPALLAAIRGATGVTVGAAAIDAGTATASAGALSLTAATGDLIIGSAAATSGSVGLSASGGVVTAAAVTGGTSVTVNGTGTNLGTVDALGTDLAITTSDPLGSLRLTDGFAAGAATLNAAGAAVIGRIDAGAIDIDAAGRLTATTLNAATTLSGAGASVAIGSAIADTGALVLTSRAGGALQLGSGRSGTTTLLDAGDSLSLTGTYRGGTGVTAQAAGGIDIATLESVNADAVVTAGGAVTAARLIAASDLTVTSNSFAIDSIEARAGSARLMAEGTTALLGSSTAIGGDLLVRGNTQASVTGSIAAGRDYAVEGASVLLGAGTPVTQTALRNIAITARDGSIVGQASLALSAAGGGAGSLVLDATGGDILFAPDTLVSGGVGRTGDIGIRLGSPGGTLRLGAVDARALLSVDAGGTVFSPLTTTGTIDLNGPVTLTRALQASTSGDILTRAITVSGVGEGLGLTTTGAGSDVTVRGRLQADGDVAVTARGDITFLGSGAAVSPTGAVTLIAQDGGIAGVGVVSAGARADIRAATDLTLTSLTSGTFGGAADRSANASAGGLSIGTATAGTALTLTATARDLQLGSGTAGTTAVLDKSGTTGALRVLGTLTTGSDITIGSTTDAALGSVTSTSGTLVTNVSGATTATLLRSDARDVLVSTGALLDAASVDAGGSVTIVAGDPLNAVSAGAIRVGTATARGGALTMTAANRTQTSVAGIVLADGSASGVTTLRTIGSGNIVTTALTARGGAATIEAAGDARLGSVDATTGAILITAGGAVSGLARPAPATDGRLLTSYDGARLTASGDVAVSAFGTAQLGAISGDAVMVTAGSDAAMIDTVSAGRLYGVTGRSVTLGLTGIAIDQTATGGIDILSQGGAIVGRSGLTLASDIDGSGGDLILRSSAGIDFAAGRSLAAGGPARVAAIRIAAGSGDTISLDRVDARSLVSYDPGLTATTLRHDGPVSLGNVTVVDTLDIGVAGAPLAVATMVSGGDIRLASDGALTATDLLSGGMIDVSGASAVIGAARAGTGATLRSTGGTLEVGSIDAAAGSIMLDAVGDLRIDRAAATAAIVATSTSDITGRSRGSGFGSATLASSGGTVTVATNEAVPSAGVVRLATVAGQGDVAIAGRDVMAATITSLAGDLSVTARRNVAGTASVGIVVESIDAAGDIGLRSGLGVPFIGGVGTIGLDRAVSRTGGIVISNADGDIGGIIGGTRTTLTSARTTTVDAAGAALLGTADAGTDLAVSARSIDLTSGLARTGMLTMIARSGDAVLGTGIAGSSVSITASGLAGIDSLTSGTSMVLDADRIDATTLVAGSSLTTVSAAASRLQTVTAGSATSLSAGGNMAIGTADIAGPLLIAAAGALDATRLTAAGDLEASAGVLDIGSAAATTGTLRLIATTGNLTLGVGRSSGATTIAAGRGLVTIGSLTSGGAADIRAARAAIGSIDTGGSLTIAADGDVLATTLHAVDSIDVGGGSVAIDTVTAERGALRLTATAGDLTVSTTRAGGTTSVTASNGLATIGAATGTGAVDVSANRVPIGSVDTAGTLTIASVGDVRLTQGFTGGDVRLTAGTSAAIGSLESRGAGVRLTAGDAIVADSIIAANDLTMRGGAIDIRNATARTGAIDLTATRGNLTLTSGSAGTTAQAIAGAGALAIGTLSSGSATMLRALTLTAGDLTSGGSLSADAGNLSIDAAHATTGNVALTATAGAARLGNVRADGGAITLLASDALAATTLAAARAIDIRAGSDLTVGTASAGTTTTLNAARDMSLGTIATGSDLTVATGRTLTAGDVTTTTGAITIDAGGTATIDRLRSASTATIRVGALTLNDGVTSGALTVTSTGDARLVTARSGSDAVITSGGSTSIGSLTVAGDAALTAGGALAIGTADSTGGVRTRSGGATTATTLIAGQTLTATGSSVAIGSATAARGGMTLTATGGDLALGTASVAANVNLAANGLVSVAGDLSAGGDYAIDAANVALGSAATARQTANGRVTITARGGAITGGAALNLASGALGVTLTSSGDIALAGASSVRAVGGDVTIAAGETAALGTVAATGRTIAVSAQDVTLAGGVTADTIRLTNIAASGATRLGDSPADNRAEFDLAGRRFDLSTAEVGRLAATTFVMDSRGRDVRIGALAIGTATGANRFEVRTGGRLDVLGRMTTLGSGATRQIVLGGDGVAAADGSGGRAGVIRIAATQGGGGRLLVGDATLDLRADRIGVGLDADFLSAIGLANGGTPLGTDQVASRYVAQPNSTLYNASFTGQPGYTDPVLLTARSLIVRYSHYALFQNTARAGDTAGAVLGTTPGAPTSGALQLVANGGATPNAFALFGTINGIGSTATSLLGGDAIAVDAAVSRTNSRANGCVIGSAGGGCLSSSIAQASLNIFDTSRSEIFRTADDLSLPFDPLVGTNNEALFSDIGGYVPSTDQECGTAATPCPPVGDAK